MAITRFKILLAVLALASIGLAACTTNEPTTTPIVAEPVSTLDAQPTAVVQRMSGQAPLYVQFSVLEAPGVETAKWDFDDGTTSTDLAPEHVFAAPGIYEVQLVATGEGETATVTYIIEVSPNPALAAAPTATTTPAQPAPTNTTVPAATLPPAQPEPTARPDPTVTAVPASTFTPVLDYGDFSSVAGIIFAGDASQTADFINLTPGVDPTNLGPFGELTSAAWFAERQTIESGFNTEFQFRLNTKRFGSTEGFAFVIQNTSPTVLGLGGGAFGYHGIVNSIAIEFDTSMDDWTADPNGNHVSIHSRGQPKTGQKKSSPSVLRLYRVRWEKAMFTRRLSGTDPGH